MKAGPVVLEKGADDKQSSREVEYPITKPEIEEIDYEEEDDDKSIESFRPCPRKAREKSPMPCPQPHKKMRPCGKAECNINFTPTRSQTSEMMFENSLRTKASDCSKSEMKRP
ncbi:hypothetical protein L3X38_043876 [Prunus dulcis]|uniref:Uncharacterized protein n=1 Tax=Prunus dulcis TaxID=3755 RepID=A0AAD4UXB6_PRUDU|nr:hypothetical protein L3X38_043876 [Prunus dulcis]